MDYRDKLKEAGDKARRKQAEWAEQEKQREEHERAVAAYYSEVEARPEVRDAREAFENGRGDINTGEVLEALLSNYSRESTIVLDGGVGVSLDSEADRDSYPIYILNFHNTIDQQWVGSYQVDNIIPIRAVGTPNEMPARGLFRKNKSARQMVEQLRIATDHNNTWVPLWRELRAIVDSKAAHEEGETGGDI